MRIIADNATRAERHTPAAVNEKIHRQTQQRIARLASNPAAICNRLDELDKEWDIERCLETGSSVLTLTGLALGVTVNRKWLLLSGIVQGFFLQHAIQGWCPPLPVFRSLGIRTMREIEAERHALKALLGEYRDADAGNTAHSVLETAMK